MSEQLKIIPTAEQLQLDLKFPQEKDVEGFKRVARNIPYALSTAEEILSDIKSDREPSLIRVILGKKAKESIPSSSMLTPIGGKLHKDEDPIEASYREFTEETTLCPMPYSGRYGGKDAIYHSEDGYKYKMYKMGREYAPRQVSITSFPIVSGSKMRAYFFQEEEDKMESAYPFTVTEFGRLLATGQLEINGQEVKMLESFTMLDHQDEDIDFDEDTRADRKFHIASVYGHILQIDDEYRTRFMDTITREEKIELEKSDGILGLYNKLKSLRQSEKSIGRIFEETRDKLEMERYSEYFRKKELYHTEVSRATGEEEIFEIASADKRANRIQKRRIKRLRAEAKVINNGLSNGNLGVDVLHLLPLFAATDVRAARVTKTYIAMQRFMRDLLVYSTKPTHFKLSKLYKETLEISHRSQLKDLNNKLNKIHKESLKFTALSFGYSLEYVTDAWRETMSFVRNFGEELRAADPSLSHVYQGHELRNEVVDATLPKLIIMAHGHPDKKVRFESARQLFIFLKILSVKESHDKVMLQGESPYAFAVESYFGQVTGEKAEVKDKKGVVIKKDIDVRAGGKWRERVVIDKKPIKSLYSLTRKSFEEKLANIRDYNSYSIVNRSETLPRTQEDYQRSIENSQEMVSSFMKFLKGKFSNYSMVTHKDENNYDDFLAYLSGDIPHEEFKSKSGKRTGSKSHLMPRRKLVITMKEKGNGKTYDCEFTFYPYQRMPEELRQQGFMGWEEKICDDREYVLRRAYQKLKGANGLIGLYDLLFPAEFYSHIREVKRSGRGLQELKATGLLGS